MYDVFYILRRPCCVSESKKAFRPFVPCWYTPFFALTNALEKCFVASSIDMYSSTLKYFNSSSIEDVKIFPVDIIVVSERVSWAACEWCI